MSLQSTAPAQRQLTLTEELEKLEQSITLMLQEIDHNFSRAHRIVTSSILPVVEQYAEHSRNVWEGSKFWKQFFEASANVSLSGYEETADDGEEEDEETATLETSATEEGTPSSYSSVPHSDGDAFTPMAHKYGTAENRGDEATPSSLSSPDYSTPRPPRTGERIAKYDSPYETLRREIQGADQASGASSTSTLPSTPRAQTYSADVTAGSSSPPIAPTPVTAQTSKHRTPGAKNDILLHRMLDRNYRIQATPHAAPSQPRVPKHVKTPGKTPATERRRGAARRDHTQTVMGGLDLDSSPLEEAPQLHADLWKTSPAKRVPGVSVLATPGGKKSQRGGGDEETKIGRNATRYLSRLSDDDDDDDDDFDGLPEGMSPPKTMQFHIPQSKLLKTPAKEASRQIVADLLMTAGGPGTDDDDGPFLEPVDSPSLVQKAPEGLDESF